jgi:hypothetical protein
VLGLEIRANQANQGFVRRAVTVSSGAEHVRRKFATARHSTLPSSGNASVACMRRAAKAASSRLRCVACGAVDQPTGMGFPAGPRGAVGCSRFAREGEPVDGPRRLAERPRPDGRMCEAVAAPTVGEQPYGSDGSIVVVAESVVTSTNGGLGNTSLDQRSTCSVY